MAINIPSYQGGIKFNGTKDYIKVTPSEGNVRVCDVRVYDRCLPAAEIREIYEREAKDADRQT